VGLRSVILANARYVKNVPGRKTDVSDAAWLPGFRLFDGRDPLDERAERLVPVVQENVLRAREITIQRARREVKTCGQRAHRQTTDAILVCDPGGGLQDALPALIDFVFC